MTITFTEEELEWIAKETFNWHVKSNAPKKLRESIEQKLKYLEIPQSGEKTWQITNTHSPSAKTTSKMF